VTDPGDDLLPGDRPPDVIDRLLAERATVARVVDHWPCSSCSAPVEVTDAGRHAFEASNRILVKRGEMPLRQDRCMLCDLCGVAYQQAQHESRLRVEAKVRAYLAIMADHHTPHHLIAEAEKYVGKFANDGDRLVKHHAMLRREASAKASTAVTGRRITYRRDDQ